ncbi:MAG: bi-domain-containing oxidoreductase [Chloroflexi bacterium]|nr:bi-domain-containing oxidoreductase [Chloroflexota bacterium]
MRVVLQNYATGELEIAEVAAPAVMPGQILVQTRSSLVSVGTEKSIIDVAQKNLLGKALARPDWVRQVVDRARTEGLAEAYRQSRARLDTPVPLGYSSAGVVLEIGHGVAGFTIGDRVACAGHGYASHAEVVSVPRNLCARIPEGVSFEQASFVALGGIALEAVRLARPEIGHRVVVIGLGLLGQLAVQTLKASGCRVLGTDLAADKLALARELGADAVVNAADDVMSAVREFTGGHGADSVLIMASTESNQPIEQAAEACRERGRIVATGLVSLDIPRQPFYDKEIEFVVSRAWGPGLYDADYEERDVEYPLPHVRWTAQRNMAAFLDLVAEGRVQVDPLITHRVPFEQALDAYEMILAGAEPCIGVVLSYGPEADTSHTIALQKGQSVPAVPSVVGVGLIGAGLYARGTLLPALQQIKGVRFGGVATASGVSGRHVGSKFGFDYCTTDYRELLQDEAVQAVFVLTRHGAHARLAAEALRAGKAVFAEKPLALNCEDLWDVLRAWQEGSGFLQVGFNRRFAPATRYVQERLAGGAGPLVVHCRCNAGYAPPDNWVHHPEEGGGRIIGEVCHFVDLIQMLTGGVPVEVYVASATGAGASQRDNITVSLKLDNGSVGSIVYAAGGDKSFPREYVEVFGRGAVAVIQNFKSASVTRAGRTARKRGFGVDRGHVHELETFFRHLRGDSRSRCPCASMSPPRWRLLPWRSLSPGAWRCRWTRMGSCARVWMSSRAHRPPDRLFPAGCGVGGPSVLRIGAGPGGPGAPDQRDHRVPRLSRPGRPATISGSPLATGNDGRAGCVPHRGAPGGAGHTHRPGALAVQLRRQFRVGRPQGAACGCRSGVLAAAATGPGGVGLANAPGHALDAERPGSLSPERRRSRYPAPASLDPLLRGPGAIPLPSR